MARVLMYSKSWCPYCDRAKTLLTAKGQELDRLTAQDVGADLFMTKPFNPRKLSATVMDVLGLS